MHNIKPFFCMAYYSKNVCWRSREFGTSAIVSARQFGTGADLSVHFGTNLMMKKCLRSEVSWILTPFISVSKHFGPRKLWTQDILAPVSNCPDISALVPKCLTDTSAPEENSASGNTGSNHGKEDGCACVIT